MAAQLKPHSRHRGIQIYAAANTHPGSKTTSLVIFTEDLPDRRPGLKRIRYRRYDTSDHTRASVDAAKFINEALDSSNTNKT